MRLLPILLASLLAVSCARQQETGPASGAKSKDFAGSEFAAADVAASAAAADVAATDVAAVQRAPETSTAPKVPAGPPMLAYSYHYGLSIAPRRVREMVARHEAACVAAGPTQCQVTGSSVSESGEDRVVGQLNLRAAPSWLKRFRDGLAGDAKSAGGRVVQAEVTSEDLSRQIVDTEAALRAKSTLRDRLQALLATRPGKLADLLDVERELARVQGEIDATQSELAVMRGRVATSEITLDYGSAVTLAPQGVWSPLAEAFGDFLGIVAFTLAGFVRLLAWTAPWLLIGGGLLWIFRKRLPSLARRPKAGGD